MISASRVLAAEAASRASRRRRCSVVAFAGVEELAARRAPRSPCSVAGSGGTGIAAAAAADRRRSPNAASSDPVRRPERDRVDGDAGRLRAGGALERQQRRRASGPVGEEQDRDEAVRRDRRGGRRRRAFRRPTACWPSSTAARERVADRGAAEAAEPVDRVERPARTSSWSVVGGAATCALAGERDQADLHALRHAVEERPDRLLRRAETRRLDVRRLHRAARRR